MSEDYSQIGTVRRRPRVSHQQNGNGASATSEEFADARERRNGSTNSNGTHRRSARSEEASEPRRRNRKTTEPQRTLPFSPEDLDEEPGFRLPFDPLRLLRAAKRNFGWILFGAALLATIGFFVANTMVDYKVSMPLMRKTSNAMRNEGVQMIDKFEARNFSDQTIYGFMKAGPVLQSVVDKAKSMPTLAGVGVSVPQLSGALSIKPSDNPDFVIVTMSAIGDLRSTVELMNLYGQEVVAYTRQVQKAEASVITQYLADQVTEADKQIQRITEDMRDFSQSGLGDYEKENDLEVKQLIAWRDKLVTKRFELEALDKTITARKGQLSTQAPGSSGLQVARAALAEMLITMKEENPLVKAKRAEIAMLEQRQDTAGATPTLSAAAMSSPLYQDFLNLEAKRPALEAEIKDTEKSIAQLEQSLKSRTTIDIGFTLKKAELQSMRTARDALQKRFQDAQLYTDNALGYFQVHDPATLNNVNTRSRWMKVALLAMIAGMMGLLATLGLVMLTEAFDTSLKTEEDISRVTGLPVLASLGDLRKMSAQQQVNWAFRTLTLLKGKLSRNSDQALVCGIISARHNEGRSTWVNLLTSAASQRGLRVLTVDTRPTSAAPVTGDEQTTTGEKKETPAETAKDEVNGHQPIHLPDEGNDISAPAAVVKKFDDPNSQSVVHIPLPGWVWNLERRKQWQDALEHWKDVDNLVIFVELPPASESEAVLLAENVPQLIWLVGSGMADAAETKSHLETIRHARCNLVGTVLNNAPPPLFNTRVARWFQRMTTALALLGTLSFANAQEAVSVAQAELRPAVATSEDRLAFSANARRKRAAWQERLTFGPGDAMDIHVFGKPALSRTNIVVGPDGRISFLQASAIVASGLSVDELRKRLDSELGRFYTEAAAPTTIVVPVSFASKKYFMLGKINAKGVYTLDRPLTLLEAVARARGLETGLYQRTTVEMADLGHSFLIRNGDKLPVDFEKLFQEGDLSQNVLLEPNDYVYFASTAANDIYILGEVMSPGPIGFVPSATLLSAIVDRGGFSEKAFKKRVLVIRGSLNQPETFVVDAGAALDARLRDFKLQPRDIVYVSARPWVRAEELLDEAASSFIQGAVTTWSGVNVGPIIKSRLLPRTRPQ